MSDMPTWGSSNIVFALVSIFRGDEAPSLSSSAISGLEAQRFVYELIDQAETNLI